MSEASLDAGNLTKGDPYPLKHAKSRLGSISVKRILPAKQ